MREKDCWGVSKLVDEDQQLYQSAVGSLLYLSIATRSNIAYAVNNVAKFCAKPTKQHWAAGKVLVFAGVRIGLEFETAQHILCV